MKNQQLIRNGIIALIAVAIAFSVWKYRQPRFSGGDQTPDIAIQLANGQQAKLSDLRGKYVLLQFWGSWCGPCRKENPYLVQLYNKYHDKGFEIFSIGIEQNSNAWKNAITNDQMIWPYHAMESMEFNGPLAQQFNIKSIPTTFLLNPEGVIMGVSLNPDYLEKMLSEKL
jgi:thiol-disulfide isomerase/thioredoxin